MSVWGRLSTSRSWPFVYFNSICLGLLGSLACAAQPSAELYRFAPVPGWVKPAAADYGAQLPEGGGSGGSWLLLHDRQYNERADGQDVYQHNAVKITSSGGVDEYSTLNLDVDPTYETLDIHTVKVVREGHISDQRHLARITALPKETDLRNRIYNGGYNINVLLYDVRVGDVVEYDYTVHARERMFPGQFSARTTIGWSVPVHWQRVRVLSPASRELFYRVTDGQKIPAPTVHGTVREFDWQWHDLAGITGDEDRPSWYSVWPSLQISSSTDWGQVARQVVPLFSVTEPASHEQLAVVGEIRKAGGSAKEQALHALQFVQEQIRYVSISIGRGAFRPSSPNTVLSRRFGDCKDKSLLLVTILRQLGIEAYPALVNTRHGRVLDGALPDPYSFDHAIVRLKIGPEVFWVDGTADKRLAPLSVDSPASYGWALVINGSTTGLENIPRPAPDAAGKKSEVLIDMSAGMNKPARLQITTSYLGQWADSQRQELADDNPQERQSNYANYIAGYYPGARTSAPIVVADDKVHDIVKVSEYYDLPPPFSADGKKRRFFVQVDELYRYANNLKASVRSSPLSIPYPADVQQTVRILLPQKWPVRNETVKVDNPAFQYVSTVAYSDKGPFAELTLDYRYRALTDVVELAAFAQYQADRKRVDDDLGYNIGPPANPSPRIVTTTFKRIELASAPKWSMLLSLALAVYLVVRYGYRWDPEPQPSWPEWPSGLRGWLILFAVLAVISPLVWAGVLQVQAIFFDVGRWPHLPELVPAAFKSSVRGIALLLGAVGILLLVALVLTAILFFRRRSSAPQLFIVVHWACISWSLGARDFLSASHLAAHIEGPQRLWGSRADLLVMILMTAYFMLSKRVKATFVVRLHGAQSFKSRTAGAVS